MARALPLFACVVALRACSAAVAPAVSAATGLGELWPAARLLTGAFGRPSLYYLSVLGTGGQLEANVFFDPVDASVGIARSSDSAVGVAQVLRARLRAPAGAAEGQSVAFVQNVAVSSAFQRQGIGKLLMRWCEAEAALWAEHGVSEV